MEQGRMNITEHEKGAMRLFAARTSAKDMVVIEGSVLGGWNMLPQELQMVPRLATALLDAGTTKKTKEAIRSSLTARGASISFSPGLDRTYFSASCLPEDTDFVLKLIAECLKDALFPASELALQKKLTLAYLEEAKTDTHALASQELSRLLFDKTHVNYADTIPNSTKRVEHTTRAHTQSFKKLIGIGGLIIAITGDVTPSEVISKAERAFSILPKGTQAASTKHANSKKPHAAVSEIPVSDKANIDVYMGAHVPITYDSPEYLPFVVMASMLGGKGLFTGHLMRTIRERDGFTYGIYAHPTGFTGLADGSFRIMASFSPKDYKRAVEATKKEIQVFLSTGITEEMLTQKKTEMVGKYAMNLATSAGLAGALHGIGVEGKPLSYIDEYPSLISHISVEEVVAAAQLVPWKELSIAAAGTFEKES
jgi:zinc protease